MTHEHLCHDHITPITVHVIIRIKAANTCRTRGDSEEVTTRQLPIGAQLRQRELLQVVKFVHHRNLRGKFFNGLDICTKKGEDEHFMKLT